MRSNVVPLCERLLQIQQDFTVLNYEVALPLGIVTGPAPALRKSLRQKCKLG